MVQSVCKTPIRLHTVQAALKCSVNAIFAFQVIRAGIILLLLFCCFMSMVNSYGQLT